jgi:UDP-N-acetylglucosamine/UDP-N-acetyl-alpha-D-glucosaminouronate 4-epimerase
MSHYLVTGGAGFIGSHLVDALVEQGGRVRVLDDFSTGKRENLEGLRSGNRLEVLEGDLRDGAVVAQAVRGIETIFHQAAFVSVAESMEKPQICFSINSTGTSLLLEAARLAGVRRVVIASSAAVYGNSADLPLREDSPSSPLSPYAVSKAANELYAGLYTRAFGLEVVALRYFNVYGPRQRPDSMYAAAVPIFIRGLLDGKAATVFGDGGQTRDLIYVGDVVRANIIAAQHASAPGQIFNVCTGEECRILDLVKALSGFFPSVSQPIFAAPRAGDIYKSLGSPVKAERELGFRAQTPLVDGLRATIKWMQ